MPALYTKPESGTTESGFYLYKEAPSSTELSSGLVLSDVSPFSFPSDPSEVFLASRSK